MPGSIQESRSFSGFAFWSGPTKSCFKLLLLRAGATRSVIMRHGILAWISFGRTGSSCRQAWKLQPPASLPSFESWRASAFQTRLTLILSASRRSDTQKVVSSSSSGQLIRSGWL